MLSLETFRGVLASVFLLSFRFVLLDLLIGKDKVLWLPPFASVGGDFFPATVSDY